MGAAEARKKAACECVIAYGYRDDRFANERKSSRDKSSVRSLIAGGYEPAAAAALEEIKKAALSNKAKYHPAFIQTPEEIRGQFRGVPNGTTRQK